MDSTKTLVDVKTALALKYERKAAQTSSTPKRKQYAFKARKYRRQLAQMAHNTEN
ncbi:hypothetical protein AB1L42_16890 [Thalassoglobus sp. JC818]|uniref:hypothetical protein n=1 Tax=Thalassoglobus sp. JC818 TaxID=3232136 RepID=UPI0034593B35